MLTAHRGLTAVESWRAWRFITLIRAEPFIEQITDGFVEALNGVLRAIMRIAFGYRNFHNFRLRAFAELGTSHANLR